MYGILPRLQPVHRGRVDGDGFLGGDVGPVLEVIVLPLLLALQVKPGQAAQVLLADCLVDRGSPVDFIESFSGRVLIIKDGIR